MNMNPGSNVEKRLRDNLSPSEIMNAKRRKIEDAEMMVNASASKKVDPSELASAFALASLASLSPRHKQQPAVRESREANRDHNDEATVASAPSWEARSPQADYAAPISPELRSSADSRRVHFSLGTKAQLVSPAITMPDPNSPRRMAMPPPSPQQIHIMSPHSPLHMSPRSVQQHRGPFVPRSPHPYRISPYGRPHHHSPMQYHQNQHQQLPPAWAHGRMYPPQALMQPPLMHPENQWICDFCNVAAFATYEDACVHEETCKIQCSMRPVAREQYAIANMQRDGPAADNSHTMMARSSSDEEEKSTVEVSSASGHWFSGATSLSIKESDSEWLSELNCFVRKNCVETFSALQDDVSRTSKRGRIALHQVGIRCCFCAHVPLKDKAGAAVSFPTSVSGIYESVKRWQRVHLEVCTEIPEDVQAKLTTLTNTNVWVPTTRQYWTDSAKALGLVDTSDGIRFGIDPIEMQSDAKKLEAIRQINRNESGLEEQTHAHEGDFKGNSPMPGTTQEGDHLVLPEDVDMIPPYVYFLMRQAEGCRFTEADRFVARSKGPVGYPGFQCRHCTGHAGLGKYFPVSAKSLSTNSTSQNIHAHLLKCRKCPDQVKDRLVQLKVDKGRSPRLEPGWRKIFFDKVWSRLHG
jgi:hypothetical protein